MNSEVIVRSDMDLFSFLDRNCLAEDARWLLFDVVDIRVDMCTHLPFPHRCHSSFSVGVITFAFGVFGYRVTYYIVSEEELCAQAT